MDLPVADPWFVRERIDDAITLVTEPHVHPLLRCNVWHVRGRDRDLVVDTALGLSPLRSLVERDLDGPLLAVATHTHGDHTGGLHEFDERAGPPRRRGGQPRAHHRHHPRRDPVQRERRRARTGTVASRSPTCWSMRFLPGGAISTAVEIAPVPVTRVLDDGDVIDLGDRAFEVLHLPGHSPGSIGLWDAASGTLFSGDAVYDGPLLDEIGGSDIDDYVATMERLRELPVTVVHGGHEPSFDRRRLVEICDAYIAARG